MLLLAAPLMVLPVVVVILSDSAPAPSLIEQAIDQLPIAGGGPAGATRNANAGTGLPLGASLTLYAGSARADSTPASISTDSETKIDIDSAQYNIMHPASMAREDLMIGQLELVFTSPMDTAVSGRIFREFCDAKPGDPYYNVGLERLPINGVLKDALVRWRMGSSSSSASFCPHLQG